MDTINKKLILIIEDEKIFVDALKEKLESEGYEIIKGYNGQEGLDLALAKHPDLILLDILMPKVDGFEVLRKLREDTWGINAKVIILTNVNDPANMLVGAGFSAMGGNYDYLVKAESSLEDVIKKVKEKLGM